MHGVIMDILLICSGIVLVAALACASIEGSLSHARDRYRDAALMIRAITYRCTSSLLRKLASQHRFFN